MQITIFSVISSVIWCNIFIILIYLLRKTVFSRCYYSLSIFVGLYLLGAGRGLFPLDFSFAFVIPEMNFYPDFYHFLTSERWVVGTYSVSVVTLLLLVWIGGFIINLGVYIVSYFTLIKGINEKAVYAEEITKSLALKTKTGIHNRFCVSVYMIQGLSSPYGIGFFRKKILLPARSYTEKQLFHILKHEYTHFLNHDLLIKHLMIIFCMFFWWNPVVFFLKRELEEVLELRCDIAATSDMNIADRLDYLDAIISCLKERRNSSKLPYGTAAMSQNRNVQAIKERFTAVMRFNVRSSKKPNVLLLCFVSLFVILSYCSIIQPSISPPVNTDIDAYSYDSRNAYLVATESQEYILYTEDADPIYIPEKYVDIYLKNGFQIKMEVES